VRCVAWPVLGLLAVGACDSGSGSKNPEKKATEPEIKLAGVYPERFDCQTIIKEADLTGLLGAVSVAYTDSPVTPERGLPRPCVYRVTMSDHMEGWTYDFDCRDTYKLRADNLFEQYKRTSTELVEAFDKEADAGFKPNDSGVEVKRPTAWNEVQVGAKAIDHHGQGLIFIDDDAPCYVRVIGPDPARRLELAKTVAKNLTFQNAPMQPRAAR